MNKKILLIATLVVLTIISIGSVSAAADVSSNVDDDSAVIAHSDKAVLKDGETIEIDNTMTNDEIQEKLNTATDNSVINFAAGNYSDVNLVIGSEDTTDNETNVTTSKTINNLTINGNGAILTGTPKTGSYYNGIFEVKNVNGFTLSGFNFIAEGVTAANMMTPSCLIIFNTTDGIVENNNISGGRFGIYVGSKFSNPNYDTIVRNNTVTNVTDMGIISFGSARTYIVNNTIIDPANHGIDVRHGTGPNCTVEGNYITGAMEAIYLMHSTGHTAVNNVINNSVIGITCYGSTNIVLDNNTFANKTKIAHFLSSGYSNIQIGEGNDYSGIWFTPMPPTFSYYVVRADAAYVAATNGTFSQSDSNTNVTYAQVYLADDGTEEQNPIEIDNGATIVLNDTLLEVNNNITVKIWKIDDNNHIEDGELINVTIDDVDYSGYSDITGAVYVDITQLSKGQHYMSVKYPGSSSLRACYWSGIIQIGENETVTKTASQIKYSDMNTTAVDVANDGRVGKNFTAVLTDSEGNPIANKLVQIGFNGNVYNRTTDENGSVSLQINLRYKGTYTFAICFLGDDDYNGSFVVAKIVVSTQKPTLTVPAKTFKASAKTKTLTATFKNANGKVVAGKKVTFTVNGKTYTATTNAKGVASVKVSLNKKGTYSFTAKYAGDNTFAAVSKKGTLKLI